MELLMKKSSILIYLIVFSVITFAQKYKPTELFTITWGDASEQLKIQEPFYYDTCGTPGDISDDIIEDLGGGPREGFVDKEENVYVRSYEFGEFKVFDNKGNLILDISRETPGYNESYFKRSPGVFYVDSNQHIYLTSFPRLTYVPVFDLLGNLVTTLYPCGNLGQTAVSKLYYNSDDVITFSCQHYGFRTYINGVFMDGGSMSWRAMDGNYYDAKMEDETTLKFYKKGDFSLDSTPGWKEEAFVQTKGGDKMRFFLGMDDEMLIYLMSIDATGTNKFQVYDTTYNLQNEVILPNYTNRYRWYSILPVVRADGNIYEFRVLDDGLHVIRWSRKE